LFLVDVGRSAQPWITRIAQDNAARALATVRHPPHPWFNSLDGFVHWSSP
jgi:hypothetical protein